VRHLRDIDDWVLVVIDVALLVLLIIAWRC
jgi:hypothetical protein